MIDLMPRKFYKAFRPVESIHLFGIRHIKDRLAEGTRARPHVQPPTPLRDSQPADKFLGNHSTPATDVRLIRIPARPGLLRCVFPIHNNALLIIDKRRDYYNDKTALVLSIKRAKGLPLALCSP